MHKGFVVLSGVNESKIFDKVESLVKDYSENADKIAAFKASVDAFDDPMAVLDHELIASLYERHDVPHALQHDAFSQEFLERWRSRIDDMIARSLAEPDEQHTLNLLFLHSAKVLNKSFLAKAIVLLSSQGSPHLQTLLLDFVPAAMIKDWGIAGHVHKMQDNHVLLLSLTKSLLTENLVKFPANLKVNVIVTDTVRKCSQEVEEKLVEIQTLLNSTPGGGQVCSTAHAFYHCYLGAENFYEYGLELFKPDTEERKDNMRQISFDVQKEMKRIIGHLHDFSHLVDGSITDSS